LKAQSLQSQVQAWRDVLTALAEDFYFGRASVDPKDYPNTCSYCEQRLLCRLNPASLGASAADDNGDADSSGIHYNSSEDKRG